jgi:hypothetical protein
MSEGLDRCTSRDGLCKFSLKNEYFGAAIVQQKLHFSLTLARSYRNDNCTAKIACDSASEEFLAIAEKDRDAIARRDSESRERECDRLSDPLELTISHCSMIDDRRSFTEAVH